MQKETTAVAQLDVLRGMAIVLMVVNHVGVSLGDPHLQGLGLVTVSEFLGSFAPVVFFFTTGFGIGVARKVVTWRVLRSTLIKGALLVVADQFMWWRIGRSCGLDFLGFIGLISIMMTLIAASRRPSLVAGLSIIIVVVLRFGFGPLLRHRLSVSGVDAWLIGISPIANVSYPLSPWFVYPLLGFLLARRFNHAAIGGPPSFNWIWMSTAVMVALASAAILHEVRAPFFRWGTMSLGYFVLSLAAVLSCVMGAWAISAWHGRLARAISLRGVTSLAVVPIHYALIGALAAVAPGPFGTTLTLVAMLLVTVLAMGISRTFSSAFLDRWRSDSPLLPKVGILALIAIAAAVEIHMERDSALLLAGMLVGQLALTALLGVARAKPQSAQSGAVALS